MKTLRVAVVGVGHFGRNHARVYNSLPGVQLVAVAQAPGPARLEREHDAGFAGAADLARRAQRALRLGDDVDEARG